MADALCGREVIVLEAHKYVLSPPPEFPLPWNPTHQYAYDVDLLVDESYRFTAALHPDCGALVETAVLQPGVRLSIQAAVDMTAMLSRRVSVVLTQLRVAGLEGSVAALTDAQRRHMVAGLEYHVDCDRRDGSPILSHAAHYSPSLDDSAMTLVPTWAAMSCTSLRRGRLCVGTPTGVQVDAAGESFAAVDASPAGVADVWIPAVEGYSLQNAVNSAMERGRAGRGVGVVAAGKRSRAATEAAAVETDAWAGITVAASGVSAAATAARSSLDVPLLGRLYAMGRLEHFAASPAAHATTVPYKFSFRIGDASRVLDIVVWNAAAAYYHTAMRALPLGTALAITGYRLKTHLGQLEVAINSGTQRGYILRIAAAERPLPSMPLPDLRFMTIAALMAQTTPHGAGCSLAGMISHVGPIHRHCSLDPPAYEAALPPAHPLAVRVPVYPPGEHADITRVFDATCGLGHGLTRGPWHAYRWLHVRDDSTRTEMCVRLAAGVGWGPFTSVKPGAPIVLTHMHVVKAAAAGDAEAAVSCAYVCTTRFSTCVVGVPTGEQPARVTAYTQERARQAVALAESTTGLPRGSPRTCVFPHVSLTRPATLARYISTFLVDGDEDAPLPALHVTPFLACFHSHERLLHRIVAAYSTAPLGVRDVHAAAASDPVSVCDLVTPYIALCPGQQYTVLVTASIDSVARVLPPKRGGEPEPSMKLEEHDDAWIRAHVAALPRSVLRAAAASARGQSMKATTSSRAAKKAVDKAPHGKAAVESIKIAASSGMLAGVVFPVHIDELTSLLGEDLGDDAATEPGAPRFSPRVPCTHPAYAPNLARLCGSSAAAAHVDAADAFPLLVIRLRDVRDPSAPPLLLPLVSHMLLPDTHVAHMETLTEAEEDVFAKEARVLRSFFPQVARRVAQAQDWVVPSATAMVDALVPQGGTHSDAAAGSRSTGPRFVFALSVYKPVASHWQDSVSVVPKPNTS